MTEQNVFHLLVGGVMMGVGGFLLAVIGNADKNRGTILFGIFSMFSGCILAAYPLWGTAYLHLKAIAGAVPTWAWVVVGATVYFNLNKIYVSWLDYACYHPGSLAQKILAPQPAGLPFVPYTTFDRFLLRTCGIMFFFLTWCTMLIWLIFGGGIAKLLHLVPRE